MIPYRLKKVVRNITINIMVMRGKSYEIERWTCKGYTGIYKYGEKQGILGGAKDFTIQG